MQNSNKNNPTLLKPKNKVAVIGAGITGITTAYQLAKRGFSVTVFDRNAYAAMETSYANGGQISASNAEVWNSWQTIFKSLKWLLSAEAPLSINPKPSWHKLSWMFEFITSILQYEKNTIATVKLAIESRNILLEMAENENINFDCQKRGILHFYQTDQDLAHARYVSQLLQKGGLEREELSNTDIQRLEPTLQGNFVGGFFTKSDFSGDIHKFTYGLSQACIKHGVFLKLNTDVVKVKAYSDYITVSHSSFHNPKEEIQTTNFDKLVICAGVYSRSLAKSLGDHVNIYPVKGYSITVHLESETDQQFAPWICLLDDAAKIVTSRLGKNRFRIAGTAEFNGFNKDILAHRITPLIKWCQQYFPDISTRTIVPWAGLRPMTPTMMPKVGPGRNPNVFYNTGHGHLGWTLSAVTATMIADYVLGTQH